jgi:hypothetical protein
MVAHYQRAAGWEASVAHGTFGIHARLFGHHQRDRARVADVIRCVPLFSRPGDDPATDHGEFGKAERTQANSNADNRNRPLGPPRRPGRCAGRGGCENKDRRRCPPQAPYGECSLARAISALAGSASPHQEPGIPASAELCAPRPGLRPGVSIRVRPNLVMLQGFHRRQLAARASKTSTVVKGDSSASSWPDLFRPSTSLPPTLPRKRGRVGWGRGCPRRARA